MAVSESTVRRYLREGVLEGKHPGKSWRVNPESVKRWIAGGVSECG